MNINQSFFEGRTLEQINAEIAASKMSITNSLYEAAIHEAGHAKLIRGKSIDAIKILYNELSTKGIEGISYIGEHDGAEAIAEIEALISRGKSLTKEAKELYEELWL